MGQDARTRESLPTPERFKDGSWQTKIEKAKQARQAGKELRKDKPATFSTRRVKNR